MDKRNILIAGGAGFIGSHLTKKLVAQGDNVVILDNLSTGNKDNLEGLASSLVICDITAPSIFKSAWADNQYDEIWNCACPASPIAYRKMPFATLDACYLGTKNLLHFANSKKAKYIHLSTSEVYGNTEAVMDERNWGRVNPYGPRSCYDEGKRIAETLIYEFQAAGLVDARIFRLFNTYGPGMQFNDGRVIPNFIMAALTNKPLHIFGKNAKFRTFCYVDDTVNLMIDAAKENYHYPTNIAPSTGCYLSLGELAHAIVRWSGSKSEIIYDETRNPTDDPTDRYPKTSLLESILGKLPEGRCIEDGIKSTIEYFRNLLAADPSLADEVPEDGFRSYTTPTF